MAGTTTGTPLRPVVEATDGCTGPSVVPGSTGSENKPTGKPKRSIKSVRHRLSRGSSNCVVDALVSSMLRLPVSSQ